MVGIIGTNWMFDYDGGIKWIMFFVTWICGFSAGAITVFLYYLWKMGKE